MDRLLAIALAFVLGCGCGYFLKDWFDSQVKKFEKKNRG